MTLQERIVKAFERITSGAGTMRVPVDETDPDVVLADCAEELTNLETQLREATEALGSAWLAGGVSLAEGIKRKTARLESVAFAELKPRPSR